MYAYSDLIFIVPSYAPNFDNARFMVSDDKLFPCVKEILVFRICSLQVRRDKNKDCLSEVVQFKGPTMKGQKEGVRY